MKRYGEPVKAGIQYTARPGVYVILPRGNQLLVTLQGGENPEFQLPGGGIDAGEHPIAALHREVMEETGWTIAAPRKLGAYRRFCYMPDYDKWAEKICHMYMARPIMQVSDPLEPDHTAVWMPADQAAVTIASVGDRAFVQSLL